MNKPRQPANVKARPEILAGLFGVKLFDQRKRRGEQLAALRAAIASPGFPKAAKGHCPRQAVADWVAAHVKISADARSFTLVTQPDLPPQPDAADGNLFALDILTDDVIAELALEDWQIANLKRFSRGNQMRLVGLYRKWINPNSLSEKSLPSHEKTELIRAGIVRESPIAGAEAFVNGDRVTGGHRGVAAYIRNNFKNIIVNVTHTDVGHWLKGNHLPVGCRENLPGADARGAYSKTAIDSWTARHLVRSGGAEQNLLNTPDHRDRQQKADADMAEMKRDLMAREISVEWFKADAVLGAFTALGHWMGLQQDRFIEDRGGVRNIVQQAIQSVNLEIKAEKLAELDQRLAVMLSEANDAMKADTARHMDDLARQMEQDRKKQVTEKLTQ